MTSKIVTGNNQGVLSSYFISAFCKPYLFIIHFSSVEIVKLDPNTYNSSDKTPVRILIKLSSPRYLGTSSSRGIYVATTNSYLELLKIDGSSNMSGLYGSLSSLDTLYVTHLNLL